MGHLQQSQDAEAQHPTPREREQGKSDPCNPDHAGQGWHSANQREARAEPSRRNTNFTVHLQHSLMQPCLPCCSTPAPFSPTFSCSFAACFCRHPQMHTRSPTETLSSSETGNPFNTNLPRCKRGKLHLAAALLPSLPSPSHSASQELHTGWHLHKRGSPIAE